MSNRTHNYSIRRALAPVSLGCVLLLTLIAPSNAADNNDNGKLLAERLCAVCHMNAGQGDKTGPGTVPAFAAVARRQGQTLQGIIDWLKSVPPMMPNHHLTQDEMQSLAFFILSLRDGSTSN